ncbi:MAG: hypothetical protein IJW46_04640, partial [Clostridia bacterium]|nr:hypothetical protein [Clostridia bacterium]
VVTSIDVPMYQANEGTVLTVQVVKFDYDSKTITEVYSKHELVVYQYVDYHWLSFDVDIFVPEGYTLSFGVPTDTAPVLYDGTVRDEFTFCNAAGDVANVTLAYRIFGYKCN